MKVGQTILAFNALIEPLLILFYINENCNSVFYWVQCESDILQCKGQVPRIFN